LRATGCLFSVGLELKMEGFRQIQRGFIEGKAMGRGPQVQGVALDAAGGLAAAEDALVQVDAEAAVR